MAERFMNQFLDMSTEVEVLGDLRVENDRLKQDLYSIQQDLDEAKMQIETNKNLREENHDLKNANANLIRENKSLRIELRACRNSIDHLNKENLTFNMQNIKLKEQVQANLQETADFRKKFETCSVENNALKSRIDQYSESAGICENEKVQEKLDRQKNISKVLRSERDELERKNYKIFNQLKCILTESATEGDDNNGYNDGHDEGDDGHVEGDDGHVEGDDDLVDGDNHFNGDDDQVDDDHVGDDHVDDEHVDQIDGDEYHVDGDDDHVNDDNDDGNEQRVIIRQRKAHSTPTSRFVKSPKYDDGSDNEDEKNGDDDDDDSTSDVQFIGYTPADHVEQDKKKKCIR